MEGRIMRVKSEWTPSGILLWLIAAIAATLVVCSQVPEVPQPPAAPAEADAEVEIEIVH
jgi:hypothetical protein